MSFKESKICHKDAFLEDAEKIYGKTYKLLLANSAGHAAPGEQFSLYRRQARKSIYADLSYVNGPKMRKKPKSGDQEQVEDLLIMLLLSIGIEARTIAKVLGVVPSAISNKFPVTEIRKQSKLLR